MYFQDRIIHKDADLNVYFPCLACCLHRGCTIKMFSFVYVFIGRNRTEGVASSIASGYCFVTSGPSSTNFVEQFVTMFLSEFIKSSGNNQTEQASTFYVVFS